MMTKSGSGASKHQAHETKHSRDLFSMLTILTILFQFVYHNNGIRIIIFELVFHMPALSR